VASIAAPLAYAQDNPAANPGSVPIITPPPSARPQQLPGVLPERFSIAPAPSPTPAPVPTPSAAPTPVARATPVPQRDAPVARATPPARAAAPVVATAPTPSATSAPVPAAVPTPLAETTPLSQPIATAAPEAAAVPETAPWIWAAAGAGGTALLGLGGWFLFGRRRREDEEEAASFEVEPVSVPAPPVQAPPGLGRTAPPTPAPTPAPVSPPVRTAAPQPRSNDPFELGVDPHRIIFAENEILLEFDLLIGNASGAAAENIRVAYAAMSAQPRQDEVIAGFHGGPPGEPAGQPFDLPAGGGGRMPVRLAIPRAGVNVVEVGGRPMFVPIVLVDLRWRGGLSIRRFGADFILGTAGQGDKLGPIWLDRPAPIGQLAANRYLARQVAAA